LNLLGGLAGDWHEVAPYIGAELGYRLSKHVALKATGKVMPDDWSVGAALEIRW